MNFICFKNDKDIILLLTVSIAIVFNVATITVIAAEHVPAAANATVATRWHMTARI